MHKPTMKEISGRAQFLGSMLMSIAKAGGSVEPFAKKFKEMTVNDLIKSLGSNNIRFCFIKGRRGEVFFKLYEANRAYKRLEKLYLKKTEEMKYWENKCWELIHQNNQKG